MQGARGVLVGKAGLRIEWRGIDLSDRHGPLEARDFSANQTRIDVDGTVYVLQGGRVQLSALPSRIAEDDTVLPTPGRKGTGPYDGWIVDTATGYRIAWRGMGTPKLYVAHVPTVRFADDYQVTFHRYGLAGILAPDGEWRDDKPTLPNGELVLDSLPPKSRQRRLRRARLAGAWDVGYGLLMFIDPDGAVWPPLERDRGKKGKQPSRPWDQNGHGQVTYRAY